MVDWVTTRPGVGLADIVSAWANCGRQQSLESVFLFEFVFDCSVFGLTEAYFFFFWPHAKPLQYLNCFQFSHHLELNFLGSQKKTNKKKQPWKGQLRVFLPHSIWSSCPACRASRRPERCPAGKLQWQKQRLKHACHQSDIIWAFSPLLSSMIKCHWKNILSNETRVLNVRKIFSSLTIINVKPVQIKVGCKK